MGCGSNKGPVVADDKLIKLKTFKPSPAVKLPPEAAEGFIKVLKSKSSNISKFSSLSKNTSSFFTAQPPDEPLTQLNSDKGDHNNPIENNLIEEISNIPLKHLEPEIFEIHEIEAMTNETPETAKQDLISNENFVSVEDKIETGNHQVIDMIDLESQKENEKKLISEDVDMIDLEAQKENEKKLISEEEKSAPREEQDLEMLKSQKEEIEKKAAEDAEKLEYEKKLAEEEDLELQKILMSSMINEAQEITEKYT
ncbi:unnamed protein product [Blepharisma stoltei]|uniref:Uncharacterized protein n=1 Tax=Blepharisma stoltei TaxID=1481888 RepID=A0AAU9J1E2_9CILI|nr:unnamed protein product [Blepharisma stoltei]